VAAGRGGACSGGDVGFALEQPRLTARLVAVLPEKNSLSQRRTYW
jgi:hypothetical protein